MPLRRARAQLQKLSRLKNASGGETGGQEVREEESIRDGLERLKMVRGESEWSI